MNFLRVLYAALLTLALAALATVFFIAPTTVGGWAATVSEMGPITRFGLAVAFDLALLILLFFYVRPGRGMRGTGLMMRAPGAITEVSVESAQDRILKAVNDLPDVVSAEVKVSPMRGRANVDLQVVVQGGHDIKLPAKQSEINRALKQVIHKQLGLQMAGQPKVHIRLDTEGKPAPVLASVSAYREPARPPQMIVTKPVQPTPKPLPSTPVDAPASSTPPPANPTDAAKSEQAPLKPPNGQLPSDEPKS